MLNLILENIKINLLEQLVILDVFSFFPTKNLGAFGDAGAIITNNHKIYKKIKMFFNHGGLKKNQHIINGINSRLDNIQALILLLKIKNLKKEIQIRKKSRRI